MTLTLPDNSDINTEENRTFPISLEYGYIPFRDLEYRKRLKEGDLVLIKMYTMIGEQDGIVLSNDGTKLKVRLPGSTKTGKSLYRSFWVKDGQSCGPADTREEWLFYNIDTPDTFGKEVIRIIELPPEYTEVISNEILENQSDLPF